METIGNPERRAAPVNQDREALGRPPVPGPAGALEMPDWAAEIQAAMQGRNAPAGPPGDAEPTVNVTIGRIDIRAVPQPARKARGASRAPGPIMSLDDYLEKRNRRER